MSTMMEGLPVAQEIEVTAKARWPRMAVISRRPESSPFLVGILRGSIV